MSAPRRMMVGSGWKMTKGEAETRAFAAEVTALLAPLDVSGLDLFVLPPFTSLAAARTAFADSSLEYGGQNMHWEESGSYTGEISGAMLAELGCRYVALAHSERLAHFAETYELVRRKVGKALAHGLTPILCLGETAEEHAAGRAEAVLRWQVQTALADQLDRLPDILLAYEPRWAIGAPEAASPDYVQERHGRLRALLVELGGRDAAHRTRIVYGGSASVSNGPVLAALEDVDGLFASRAAWPPEGYAALTRIVRDAALAKKDALR